ncbi:MAG: ABC transporter ATP-binding protein [Actinomycetota bacterium]|nr:ABC transporter ATP-binding protein [Actinomycetota bacterium]
MLAIEAGNLTKKYGKTTVLDNLNLNINEGEFYCLMGPNGSGKTTLSSIIASVRLPTSGEVKIFGKKPEQSKRLIGYIPQENFSDPNLTGIENINYFAKMLGYSNKDAKAIALKLLKKVGLFEERDKRVFKFSGGMRKKLELSTILFPHIKIFILDEPTTGLDPSARRNFFGLIDELKDKSTTVLLISHIGSDAELATRVGLMDKGKIIAEGSPDELKNNSGLKNMINIELSVKNEKVKNILSDFNKAEQIFETSEGYKIYSDETSEVIPEIVRSVEASGYKVLQIGSVIPSLEDVFFKLTGKKVREANEESKETKK